MSEPCAGRPAVVYWIYGWLPPNEDGWLEGEGSSLLYVGMSTRWAHRRVEHARDKWWWSDVRRVEVIDVCCERHARVEERLAIESGVPAHNIALVPQGAGA